MEEIKNIETHQLNSFTNLETTELDPYGIIFIDSRVADRDHLIAGANTSHIVILDADRDGIEQITAALEEHENLSSIHIVSHGESNSIQLGATELNDDNLEDYTEALENWSNSLAADADILVYSCNVASASDEFIHQLSQLTKADVAASKDLTGNAELGGDWELEAATGKIESSLAFDRDTLESYSEVLADGNFNFPNFTTAANIKLNGKATIADNTLNLTPSEGFAGGSAFVRTPISLGADTSFQTRFQFKLSGGQGTNGADGFTFILQNSSAGLDAIGTVGGGLGYSGIGRSIAIKFDTFRNTDAGETSNNSIAILQNGDVVAPLAKADIAIDLNSGNSINAWVEYDGATNRLNIFLSTTTTKPATASISQAIDLPNIIGNNAYVGFSGATGGLWNKQSIENWQFTSTTPTSGGTVTPVENLNLSYPNFADPSRFQLNGNTSLANNLLNLSPGERYSAGSAFIKTPLALKDNTSFQSRFQFKLSGGQGTGGADGFTFMLQNSTAGVNAVGSLGGALGYGGIDRSIAIKFDSFQNAEYGDTSSNSIAILQNGNLVNPLAKADIPLDLNSGSSINAWVEYDGVSNRLDIFLSNTATKPATATISQTVDITSVIGDRAYIGFSAGTGYLWNVQTIENCDLTTNTPSGGTGGISGTLSVRDNQINVNEGDGTAKVTIVRTGGSDTVATIDYTTVNTSATAGSDYTETKGTLRFNIGETEKTITIPILDDNTYEGTEVFGFAVDRTEGAKLGVSRTAQINILDNDPVPSGTDYRLNFNNFADISRFQLNGDTSIVGGVLRLTPDSGFATGSAFIKEPFLVNGNTSFQSRFQFKLTGTRGTNGADGFTFILQNSTAGASAIGVTGGGLGYGGLSGRSLAIKFDTYQNTDQGETSSNSIAILRDGNVVAAIAKADIPIDLNSGNPVNAWIDYNGNTDSLNIYLSTTNVKPATATISQTVDLAGIIGDRAYIGFSAATGALTNNHDIENWEFTSTVAAPAIEFKDPSVSIRENDGNVIITVTRGANGSGGAASIDFTTVDGSAKAGADYTGANGRLTFAPGETTKTITIPILDDNLIEQNKTFTVTLSNAIGNDLGTQTSTTITIVDNDAAGNFIKETVISGLNQPTAMDWTRDGRFMFIAQKDGVVRIAENGVLRSTPFIDISNQVNSASDRGLLGIAVHPDFAQNPYVYLLFTYDPPEVYQNSGLAGADQNGNRPSRLIRVTVDPATGNLVAGSEVVLLGKNSTWANISGANQNSTDNMSVAPSGIVKQDGTKFANADEYLNNLNQAVNVQDYLATDSQSHSIGDIRFGNDGSLFVSNGDGTSYGRVDARTIRVQDINNLSGKILRIDPITGQGLNDNPFFNGDPNSNASKVYNYGLRNPFRFTISPFTGDPVIGDVGWTNWEEINTGRGKNFGWPYYEGGSNGNLQTGGYSSLPQAQDFYNNPGEVIAPIIARNHNQGATAILLGDFYTGNSFPSIYNNALFFGDINKGLIEVAFFDASGKVSSVQQFANNTPYIVQMKTGRDSNLYYVNIAEGTIGRWRYA